MPRKNKGREVSGILVLDKPSGLSSNQALQQVKKLFFAQKAGHTGSLDPLASGVLPICLGEATKVSHFLLDADKRYQATCQFGILTTTGDSEGETLSIRAVPEYDEQSLSVILNRFKGEQQQIPPMYSALKYQGRPLYELARQGKEVARKARQIFIHDIKLLAVYEHSIDIEVHCSKGTYIRTLCEDIGNALACGAHLTALRRLASGPFTLQQSISLDELKNIHHKNRTAEGSLSAEGSSPAEGSKWRPLDNLLLAADAAIMVFPRVDIDEKEYGLIRQGQAIEVSSLQSSEFYRLYYKNTLRALAVKDKSGRLTPKRLLFI